MYCKGNIIQWSTVNSPYSPFSFHKFAYLQICFWKLSSVIYLLKKDSCHLVKSFFLGNKLMVFLHLCLSCPVLLAVLECISCTKWNKMFVSLSCLMQLLISHHLHCHYNFPAQWIPEQMFRHSMIYFSMVFFFYLHRHIILDNRHFCSKILTKRKVQEAPCVFSMSRPVKW